MSVCFAVTNTARIAGVLSLGALGLLPSTVQAQQAQSTQVTCTYAVTATNSPSRRMGARYSARFALFNGSGSVQQYNSTTQRWARWTTQTFTPQRVAMTAPSGTSGCNLAAQMNRSSGEFRMSMRCTNRTAVDYVGSCARAAATLPPRQRF